MAKKSMILVKCPSCGANAKLAKGNICECEYCGATFLVTTSSEEAANIIISPSEADLKSNQINTLVEKCEDAINKENIDIAIRYSDEITKIDRESGIGWFLKFKSFYYKHYGVYDDWKYLITCAEQTVRYNRFNPKCQEKLSSMLIDFIYNVGYVKIDEHIKELDDKYIALDLSTTSRKILHEFGVIYSDLLMLAVCISQNYIVDANNIGDCDKIRSVVFKFVENGNKFLDDPANAINVEADKFYIIGNTNLLGDKILDKYNDIRKNFVKILPNKLQYGIPALKWELKPNQYLGIDDKRENTVFSYDHYDDSLKINTQDVAAVDNNKNKQLPKNGCIIIFVIIMFGMMLLMLADGDENSVINDNFGQISATETGEHNITLIEKEGHPRLYDKTKTIKNFYDDNELKEVSSSENKRDNAKINYIWENKSEYITKVECNVKYTYPDLTIQEVLPIIRGYIPMDIIETKYEFGNSCMYFPNTEIDNKGVYYVIEYKYNSEEAKRKVPYSKSINIIVKEDDNIITSFSICPEKPNWMFHLDTVNYQGKTWDYKF